MVVWNMRAIDCDMHPVVPGIGELMPFLVAHWREAFESRGTLDSIPLPIRRTRSCRPGRIRRRGQTAGEGRRVGGSGAMRKGMAVAPSCSQSWQELKQWLKCPNEL